MNRHWLAVFPAENARSAVSEAAEIARGYVPVRLRNHAEEVWPGDLVAFWVRGRDGVEGVYAVGRVFSRPEWTVVHGELGEDEYVVGRIVWLKYSLIADQVTLGRDAVEGRPTFENFEFFTAPASGNLFTVTEGQWRVLFHSVAHYCRRHDNGDKRAQTGTEH
jgi:hypothetical protein